MPETQQQKCDRIRAAREAAGLDTESFRALLESQFSRTMPGQLSSEQVDELVKIILVQRNSKAAKVKSSWKSPPHKRKIRSQRYRSIKMNSVSLIGRFTADPEMRYLESGKAIAKFSLAVNRTKDESDFFDVEAWEKTAEVIAQYCKKGTQVGVSGSLLQERWKDKTTGTGRSKVVIRCSRIELLGSRPEGEGQGYAQAPAQEPAYAAVPAASQPSYAAQTPAPSYGTQGAAVATQAPPDVDYTDISF